MPGDALDRGGFSGAVGAE
jgi:2,4-dienoyl-CoA reductase-like NADH-dependent reductase (Old Yellow Enzyme family)